MELLEILIERRKRLLADLTKLLEDVEGRKASRLSDSDQRTYDAAMADVKALDERIEVLQDQERREGIAGSAAMRVQGGTDVRGDRGIYSSTGEHSLLQDAYLAQFRGDPGARARLDQHQAEQAEVRDVGTGAFSGLVVPQYLTDLYAPRMRAGRPLADSIRKLPLSADGMVENISRITTGSAVASQATENDPVQETNMDDTLLTVNVRTIAGMQDVSRQAVERGTLVDQVVIEDLASAYHAELDRQIINADGTSGTHLGILATAGTNAITYTDASPTVSELNPKLADAMNQVNAGNFTADLIVMHSRRWAWCLASVDSAGRPIVVPQVDGPTNAVGTVVAPGATGRIVGQMLGLPVITDANIPTNLGGGTNEDAIFVVSSSELFLWEDVGSPVYIRAEEVLGNQLTIRFVLYGYSAFTAGRQPAAVSKITGTGLAAPTF